VANRGREKKDGRKDSFDKELSGEWISHPGKKETRIEDFKTGKEETCEEGQLVQ
jgi:hypothetical protein